MATKHKFAIHFTHVPLTHDAQPVPARRTVEGLNLLDAQCRLRKAMHSKGRRIHMYTGGPGPDAELHKALREAKDLAAHAYALLRDLERSLA